MRRSEARASNGVLYLSLSCVVVLCCLFMCCVVYVYVLCCLCACVYSSVFVVLYPDVFSEGLMECSLTLDVVLRFCLCFVVFFALLCYHQLPLLCCVMLFCPKD